MTRLVSGSGDMVGVVDGIPSDHKLGAVVTYFSKPYEIVTVREPDADETVRTVTVRVRT